MAEALYRKYRPQIFEDVVGQDHIERTLKNAIDQGKVSHAYLFCGPRGTGKTTTARLLAKALLCENGPTSSPDGTCQNCLDVAEGQHPDVYELDAASRTGVENVREEIIGRVNFAPSRGSKKIYIIDEVHMLSTAAFNALLKTLEEPPSHVVFVLCTTDPQKVPATIHSRCQRFDFHRIGTEEIVSRLGAICMAEGATFEGDALTLIAHRADGGMRNALTTLEQLITFGGGNVTVQGAEDLLGSLGSSDMAQLMDAVGRRDVAACFTWVANYMDSGADLAQFARDMAEHVRNLYVMAMAGSEISMDLAAAEREQLESELKLFGADRASRMLGVLGDLIVQLKTAGNPRLCFEIALTRMVRPDSDLTLESLAERIEALERGVCEAAPVPAVQAAPVAAPAPVQQMQALAAAPQPVPAAPSAVSAGVDSRQPAAAAPVASAATPAPAPAASSAPAGEAAPPWEALRSTAPAPASAPSQARPVPPAPVQPAAPAPAVVPTQTAAPVPEPAFAPAPAVSAPQTQPASAPATPAAAQPAGDLSAVIGNPAALQRVWRSVVAAVKKEKVSYGVLFVNVRVKPQDDGSGVVIEFPADNPFAFSVATSAEATDVIARAFAKVAGMPVPFKCVKAGGADSAAPSNAFASAAPAPEPAPAPFIPPAPAPAVQPAPAASPAPSQVPPWEEPGFASGAPSFQVGAPVAPPVQPASPATASVPPWEEPASAPAPVAGGMQAQAGVQDPGAFYEDSVPLDAYDDMAPYGDCDAYSYDDGGYAPAPSPVAPAASPASSQVPPWEDPANFPVAPAQASVSDAELAPFGMQGAPDQTTGEPVSANADDLSKMLSSSMGANIVFKEV